ncbi:hypothetical protein DPMN_065285 [Dreissena polymorpha]|uniref:DUF1059 domain-containing protein n=1 Tax=Dreissena polymorpha TaxID=45954 RepID=A0A9D4HKY9_DREPO|nr:hypothetical protein DPMN_065285 [Dreissena polymorpha]
MSKARVCPVCVRDRGIEVSMKRLTDHLRSVHRMSAAEMLRTTSAAKAHRAGGTAARTGDVSVARASTGGARIFSRPSTGWK